MNKSLFPRINRKSQGRVIFGIRKVPRNQIYIRSKTFTAFQDQTFCKKENERNEKNKFFSFGFDVFCNFGNRQCSG
jgi:hypothetical protein